MKAKASIFTTFLLLIGGVSLLPGTAYGAINGKAAAVIQLVREPTWGEQPPMQSKLLVVTINNGTIAKTDTILRDSIIVHPTWSFDGTRIAFFRPRHGISIVNADGTNLHDVWRGMAYPLGSGQTVLSWPGVDSGKWIYFQKIDTEHGVGNGEIWRVNVNDTTQKQMMFDYIPGSAWCSVGACLQRWAVSANARYAIYHCYDIIKTIGVGCDAYTHLFPEMKDGKILSPQCIGGCDYGCNVAISAGGNWMYHFSGSHTGIYFHRWIHTGPEPGQQTDLLTIGTGPFGTLDLFKDIMPMLSKSNGALCQAGSLQSLIWPRSAVNSDKIFTVNASYRYTAEYLLGTIALIINWKDKQGVVAATYPKHPFSPGTNVFPTGDTILCAEPCNFYVTGGPAGCYEDTSGKWIDIVSNQVVGVGNAPKRGPGGNRVPGNGMVDLYRLNGTRIGTIGSDRLRSGISGKPGRGAYLVVSRGTYAISGPGAPAKAMMVYEGILLK
jgi:hypothetical protein